jgi:hypothetical protein
VVLASQARELGYTWDAFHAVVVDEGWKRLFHGAYLAMGYPDSPMARARAIQLRNPDLVASHELAAAAHGWGLVGTPELGFTSTTKSRTAIPGGRLYRWLLPASEIVVIDGVRVTAQLRTATDLMRRADRDTAVLAVDSALRLGHLKLDAIADKLERLVREPGVRRAWRAFVCLDPKSGSVTESKARLLMWDRKIYPQTQVPLPGQDGKTYYADAVAEGVVFESEGFIYHGDAEAHEDDVRRFNAVANAARGSGHDFCRLTYRGLFHRTRETGDLIVRTIAARKRRLLRGAQQPPNVS